MKLFILLIAVCFSRETLYSQVIENEEQFPEIAISKWLGIGNSEGVIFEGKTVIIEFWATWCQPCIEAIPHLNDLGEKFQEADVLILSLNSFESEEVIAEFMKNTTFLTDVVMDDNKKTYNSLGITLIPKTVIIDKNGRLRWIGDPGQLTEQVLDHFLEHDEFLKPVAAPLLEFFYEINVAANRNISKISVYSEGIFGFSFENKNLSTILGQLLSFVGYKNNEIHYVNAAPIEPQVDLLFKADELIPQNEAIGMAIENLKHSFKFKIDTVEEMQDIVWLELHDSIMLAAHKVADSVKYTRKKEGEMGIVTGSTLAKMGDMVSYTFNKPVYTDTEIDFKFDYSLYINDKEKLKTHFNKNYGVNVIEKKRSIQVLYITFF